jgi:hypothetical protein
MWKIRRAFNKASKWQMGFNSAFKGERIPLKLSYRNEMEEGRSDQTDQGQGQVD